MFSKNRTITMSQRDVPGMTRSVIPLLRESGVQAITVGVNGATAPPGFHLKIFDSQSTGVPSAFVWEDPSSGQDILAMWHPGNFLLEFSMKFQVVMEESTSVTASLFQD